MNDGRVKTSPSGTVGCCGPETAQMMESCPCGSFLKRHWLAAFAGFSLILLMFLVSQVGGALGIVAFVRTL